MLFFTNVQWQYISIEAVHITADKVFQRTARLSLQSTYHLKKKGHSALARSCGAVHSVRFLWYTYLFIYFNVERADPLLQKIYNSP